MYCKLYTKGKNFPPATNPCSNNFIIHSTTYWPIFWKIQTEEYFSIFSGAWEIWGKSLNVNEKGISFVISCNIYAWYQIRFIYSLYHQYVVINISQITQKCYEIYVPSNAVFINKVQRGCRLFQSVKYCISVVFFFKLKIFTLYEYRHVIYHWKTEILYVDIYIFVIPQTVIEKSRDKHCVII